MAQVVVATKTSAWQRHSLWYEEQFRRGSLAEADYERIRRADSEHLETVQKVKEAFSAAGLDFRCVPVDSPDWAIDSNTEVLVTLGGDGTLLTASHRVGNQAVTMFGLRSSGTSVGYLCAGGLERLGELVTSIQKREFKVLLAARFHGEIHAAGQSEVKLTPPALNDFLYSNANPAAMTRYKLSLGDRHEEQKSSGMWLSTALGSTAGILAAGGVSQPRQDRNFQFVVRELYRIAGKNFYLVNGFFDPDKKILTIENRCENAILAADGNHSVTELGWGDRIVFKRSMSLRIAE